MEKRGRIEIAYGIFSFISIFIGFLLFKYFSITTKKILELPLQFPKEFLMLRLNENFIDTVFYFVKLFIRHSIPFIPITIGIVAMTVCGIKYGETIETTLTFFILSSLLGLVYLGLTPTTIFLSAGIIAAGFFVSGMGESLPNELEKWRRYRTGAKTICKTFFIINMLLTLGVFTMLSGNVYHFEDIYESETRSMAMEMVPSFNKTGDGISEKELVSMLPEDSKEIYSNLSENRQEKFLDSFKTKLKNEDYKSQIKRRVNVLMSSDKISAFIDLTLLFLIFAIYGILELLRTAVISPFAGVVTSIWCRI